MSASAERPRTRRRYLQFSMRGVLLLTLGAAAVFSWIFAPPERRRSLGLGGASVQEQFARLVDSHTGQATLQLNGRWVLRDEFGVARVQGAYSAGVPVGEWTFHDADGNLVQHGAAHEGVRQGTWTSRYADGTVKSQAEYALAATLFAESRPMQGALGGSYAGPWREDRFWRAPIAARTGAINVYWPDGAPRMSGAFQQLGEVLDSAEAARLARQPRPAFQPAVSFRLKHGVTIGLEQRVGAWRTFDEHGRALSAGEYRDGVRDGTWSFAADQGMREVKYANGQPVDDVAAEVARLAEQANGASFRERHRAVWRLMQLGSAARAMLLSWLNSDSMERRRMAAGALARFHGDAELAAALARSAASDSEPRELRLSILNWLTRMEVRSPSVADALQGMLANAADRELRAKARLATIYLAPERFDDIVKAMLQEAAKDDPPMMRSSLREFHDLLFWSTLSCAEAWRSSPRDVRLGVIAQLARHYTQSKNWSGISLVAEELIPLAQRDEDSQVRVAAAPLPPADPPPVMPHGGGSFGFNVPPTRGHRP